MADTILTDIGLCKNNVIKSIKDSDDIKDLLLIGQTYSDEMWYGKDDDDGILYKQIYPYLYMDETQTEVKSYICCEIDVPRIPTSTIKDLTLVVWCICHKSAMRCSKNGYLGTRADMLADAVERALRNYELQSYSEGHSAYGIGRLSLDSSLHITSVNKEFYGRQLVFSISDFKIKKKLVS